MPINWTGYDNGIRALHADGGALDNVLSALSALQPYDRWFAIVFFSDAAIDPDTLAQRLCAQCPGLEVTGCTTAGELTPAGILDGDLLFILFPRDTFTVSSLVIDDMAAGGMGGIAASVGALRESHAAKTEGSDHDRAFALCLIDGMSNAEEAVTAAIFWGLDDIPLIGGSAGDHMEFRKTFIIAEGRASSGRAVIHIMSTALPFQIFKSDNFIPSTQKLVVTASDPDRRIVYEFNAAPAADEYAAAIGIDPQSLTPLSFASHPVVVRVGGEYFCRSIQKVNPDRSLSFFCAIDDGVVLTVARAQGMVESTRNTLNDIAARLGGIDVILGFDCILRRLDAQNRQVFRGMSELYRDNRVIGFGTYGEQYQSLHLNQTLTGIAFGKPGKAEVAP
ncbi:MAG: FIST N-terminal domain-containing protein [Rhizobiaceae bacterium]